MKIRNWSVLFFIFFINFSFADERYTLTFNYVPQNESSSFVKDIKRYMEAKNNINFSVLNQQDYYLEGKTEDLLLVLTEFYHRFILDGGNVSKKFLDIIDSLYFKDLSFIDSKDVFTYDFNLELGVFWASSTFKLITRWINEPGWGVSVKNFESIESESGLSYNIKFTLEAPSSKIIHALVTYLKVGNEYLSGDIKSHIMKSIQDIRVGAYSNYACKQFFINL